MNRRNNRFNDDRRDRDNRSSSNYRGGNFHKFRKSNNNFNDRNRSRSPNPSRNRSRSRSRSMPRDFYESPSKRFRSDYEVDARRNIIENRLKGRKEQNKSYEKSGGEDSPYWDILLGYFAELARDPEEMMALTAKLPKNTYHIHANTRIFSKEKIDDDKKVKNLFLLWVPSMFGNSFKTKNDEGKPTKTFDTTALTEFFTAQFTDLQTHYKANRIHVILYRLDSKDFNACLTFAAMTAKIDVSVCQMNDRFCHSDFSTITDDKNRLKMLGERFHRYYTKYSPSVKTEYSPGKMTRICDYKLKK